MKQTIFFSVFSSLLALVTASAQVDCLKLSLSVKSAVAAEESKVLEVVSEELTTSPSCACEVVKAAIEASSAKPETVAAIVEAAVNAAPEEIRMIAQCAVAVAPDAFSQVQVVLAKFDPNSGESVESAKDSKVAKDGEGTPNPLDFPGDTAQDGVIGSEGGVTQGGSLSGGPGGAGMFPMFPPVVINPPETTPTNPSKP